MRLSCPLRVKVGGLGRRPRADGARRLARLGQRRLVTLLARQHEGEVAALPTTLGWLPPSAFSMIGKRAVEELFGLVVALLQRRADAEVVQDVGDVGMVGAVDFLEDRQRAAVGASASAARPRLP